MFFTLEIMPISCIYIYVIWIIYVDIPDIFKSKKETTHINESKVIFESFNPLVCTSISVSPAPSPSSVEHLVVGHTILSL
jgi:hypothetical protein